MAGISVTYNGIDLSQWMVVTDVQRNIGANHVNTTQVVGKSDGQLWQYSRLDTRTIVVTGQVLNDNLVDVRQNMGAALEHDGPAPLVFGDDVSVYYNALADGQDTIAEDWRSGTVTLTFIVPDGVAHAVNTVTYDNHNADGTLADIITVNNEGTYTTYPVLTATVSGGENGLIAFASSNGGVLQFGDPEEVDGEELKKSDRALHWDMRSKPSSLTVNTGAVYQYKTNVNSKKPNLITGSIKFGTNYQGKVVSNGEDAWPSYSSGAKVWHGPAMRGVIGPNSDGVATGDFLMKTRVEFAPSKSGYGRMDFIIESGGKPMITATLRDSTKVNTRKVFEMYVSGSYHKVVTLDAKKFAKNFLELEIGRHGNTITFHIATINSMTGDGRNIKSTGVYNAHTSIAPNTVIDGLTTTAWAYDTGKADTMYWTNLEFDWVNVEYWHDIPNRFQDGDVLTVDTYDHSVMLNGVEVNDLQAVDNDWDSFALDPGSTDIEIVTSSWATATTDASIKIREAYV